MRNSLTKIRENDAGRFDNNRHSRGIGEAARNHLWFDIWAQAALWVRIVQNVKKLSLSVNVINFEFFCFYVSIWVPWNPLGPKKSWYIARISQTQKICREKQGAFCSISKISMKSHYSCFLTFLTTGPLVDKQPKIGVKM